MTEDLRGSTPVYSAKDILQRVDERTERMDKALEVILAADLPARMTEIERWRYTIEGGATEKKENRLSQRGWVQAAAAVIMVLVTTGSVLGIWDALTTH